MARDSELEARIADLERQLTDERARIDYCWTHLLAEAQGVIDAKCTIAGCWKTKYEEAQGKLDAVRDRAERHTDAQYTGSEYLAGMNSAGRDILRILKGE